MRKAALYTFLTVVSAQAYAASLEDKAHVEWKMMPAALIKGQEGYILKVRNLDGLSKACSVNIRYAGQTILSEQTVFFPVSRGIGIPLNGLQDIALRAESLATVENPYHPPNYADLEIASRCIDASQFQSVKVSPVPEGQRCDFKSHPVACDQFCRATDARAQSCFEDRLSVR